MVTPPLLELAFAGMQASLPTVLSARGCREGWIQAELFRFYHSGHDPEFSVNTFRLNARNTIDLEGYAPQEWIAELKIYGLDFLKKNINGKSDISRFIPAHEGKRILIKPSDLQDVHPREGSILKDMLRLQNAKVKNRFMIMVLDLRGQPNDFGSAIRAIQLSRKETTWHFDDVMVRVWKI